LCTRESLPTKKGSRHAEGTEALQRLPSRSPSSQQLNLWRGDPRLATKFLVGCSGDAAASVLTILLGGTQGLEVNPFHLNAALRACDRASQWATVLGLVTVAGQAGVVKDAITCTTAMNSCARGGNQWALALQLMGEMPRLRLDR
ncbi:unnamed protein product, partial [Polarella glacialis]